MAHTIALAFLIIAGRKNYNQTTLQSGDRVIALVNNLGAPA